MPDDKKNSLQPGQVRIEPIFDASGACAALQWHPPVRWKPQRRLRRCAIAPITNKLSTQSSATSTSVDGVTRRVRFL